MNRKFQTTSRRPGYSSPLNMTPEFSGNRRKRAPLFAGLPAAAGFGSIGSQCCALRRLDTFQRRLIIQKSGKVQGNRHVQRLVQANQPSAGRANLPGIQREGDFYVPYRYAPPEITAADATNDRGALARARLEDLLFLYGAGFRLHRLSLPPRPVYSRQWVLDPEGTALLRGHIRAALNQILDRPPMQQPLIDHVNAMRGAADRKQELVEMIRGSFLRAERLGLERARRSASMLTETGRQGRTWSPRGRSRDRTRDLSGRVHAAMDVPAPTGTGVYAPLDGRVIFSGRRPGFGNLVRILHESPPRTEAAGEGPVSTNYAHLDRRLVQAGDRVRAGAAIGLVGTERAGPGGPGDVGGVTRPIGAHLHFSVQRVPGEGVGPFGSRYEERRDIRVQTADWLNELGVAVTGSDDRALRHYEEQRRTAAGGGQ